MAKAEEEKFLSEAELTDSTEKVEVDYGQDAEPMPAFKELEEMDKEVLERVVAPVVKKVRYAKCPVCDEHRYAPDLADTKIVCTNCRREVKLEGKV